MSRCGLPVLTPDSSAAMERSNGRFVDQKTEMRRHPSLAAQQKGKQARECHRFARPPQHALLSALDSAARKSPSPSSRLPYAGRSNWKPRSERGRPRGWCLVLHCSCRNGQTSSWMWEAALHLPRLPFDQRYRPRPTVSGLDFLAVEIVPSTTPCNSSKVRELGVPPPSGPPSFHRPGSSACQRVYVPSARKAAEERREVFGWLRDEWAPHFHIKIGQSCSGHRPLFKFFPIS